MSVQRSIKLHIVTPDDDRKEFRRDVAKLSQSMVNAIGLTLDKLPELQLLLVVSHGNPKDDPVHTVINGLGKSPSLSALPNFCFFLLVSVICPYYLHLETIGDDTGPQKY
ncbi:hypothetical protein FRC18_006466 [Serendipita sp. 400]|nr:hypothetical protein FRC18_006466 [Serendipita sp. 400]